AGVHVLAVRAEAGGWSHPAEQDRVLGVRVVERQVESQPVIEEPGIEADLELLAALGAQVRVAEKSRSECCGSVRAGDRVEGAERREGSRLLSRLSVRSAKLEGGYPAGCVLLEEGLLVQYPR